MIEPSRHRGSPHSPNVKRDDKDSRVEEGRYIADHIPGAEFVELEGEDHFVAINPDQIVGEVELFVTGKRASHPIDRKLGTILFVDIVDSTGRAITVGDERWSSILVEFGETARERLDWHRGRFVNSTGSLSLSRMACSAGSMEMMGSYSLFNNAWTTRSPHCSGVMLRPPPAQSSWPNSVPSAVSACRATSLLTPTRRYTRTPNGDQSDRRG